MTPVLAWAVFPTANVEIIAIFGDRENAAEYRDYLNANEGFNAYQIRQVLIPPSIMPVE